MSKSYAEMPGNGRSTRRVIGVFGDFDLGGGASVALCQNSAFSIFFPSCCSHGTNTTGLIEMERAEHSEFLVFTYAHITLYSITVGPVYE